MTLRTRIDRLEESMDASTKELIVYIRNWGEHAPSLPNPRKEILRQRREGKRVIVVEIPDGYNTDSIEETI